MIIEVKRLSDKKNCLKLLKRLFLLVCMANVFCHGNSIWGQRPRATSLWQEAAQAYKDGNYLKAAELYGRFSQENPEIWQAYYNAGNADFKANNYPEALEQYWKAIHVNPRSNALWRNLAIACQKTGDTPAPAGVPYALYRLWNLLNFPEWTALTLILWWALALSLFVLKYRPGAKTSANLRAIAWAGGAGLAVSLALTLSHAAAGRYEWMILKGPGLLRSGPSESLPITTQIPEGRFVRILEKKEGWILVQTRKENLQGWLR